MGGDRHDLAAAWIVVLTIAALALIQ